METHFFDGKTHVPEATERILPHWSMKDIYTFATWRLADALPQAKLQEWSASRDTWILNHPKPWDEVTERLYAEKFGDKLEKWLDSGYGLCELKDNAMAEIVEKSLLHFHGERYKMVAYAIMPNHVHVLFHPMLGWDAGSSIQAWKSFSAHAINKARARKGPLWQQESWDRLIRNELHFERVISYILEKNHGKRFLGV
jgi:REP element-mobilizing transposase RayT